MLRVALRSTCLAVCFLMGIFVTQVAHEVYHQFQFKYVGVACGPHNSAGLYKASDGTRIKHSVLEASAPGFNGNAYIQRIEELNRQGTIRIVQRWPKGWQSSEKFLVVSTKPGATRAALLWVDEFGFHEIRSRSLQLVKDFARPYLD